MNDLPDRPAVLRAREMGELLRAQRVAVDPYRFSRATSYRPPAPPRPATQPDGTAEAAAWLRGVHEHVLRESRGVAAVRDRVDAERAILAHVLAWDHSEDRPVYYQPCITRPAGMPCECHLEWRQLAILGPLSSGWKHMPGYDPSWSA